MRWTCRAAGTATWPSCKTRREAKCRQPFGMCGGSMTVSTTGAIPEREVCYPQARSGEQRMKKIPVGTTIAHAYGFAVGHFLPVLRALWIPLLLQLAVVLVLSRRMALLFAAIEAKDPSAATLAGPVFLLFCLAVILFAAQYA